MPPGLDVEPDDIAWQTAESLARETGRDARTVPVRPEPVVEVAFDALQRSPRHPAGPAPRFARVLRYRPDRGAAEADTVASVRESATAEGS
ncbi:ATP-dependent DNA ligase [Kitasatospora sp. Ki12]